MNYSLRAIIKVGGSLCVAIPLRFRRRNFLEADRKIIVIDEFDHLIIKKMTIKNLAQTKKEKEKEDENKKS